MSIKKVTKFARNVRKKKKIEDKIKELGLSKEEEEALLEQLEVIRQLKLVGLL